MLTSCRSVGTSVLTCLSVGHARPPHALRPADHINPTWCRARAARAAAAKWARGRVWPAARSDCRPPAAPRGGTQHQCAVRIHGVPYGQVVALAKVHTRAKPDRTAK